MNQKGFYVDMMHCSGCRCCQVACKDTKDLPVGVFYRQVHDFEGGVFPDVWAASLSLGCNHCKFPQCAKNCPVAAYEKQPDTGLVIHDTAMCIGCRKCIESCPYGAPAYDPISDTVRKCDGCISLLKENKLPACVAACSTRCLEFGELDELAVRHSEEFLASDLIGLPESDITQPSVLIHLKEEMRV